MEPLNPKKLLVESLNCCPAGIARLEESWPVGVPLTDNHCCSCYCRYSSGQPGDLCHAGLQLFHEITEDRDDWLSTFAIMTHGRRHVVS